MHYRKIEESSVWLENSGFVFYFRNLHLSCDANIAYHIGDRELVGCCNDEDQAQSQIG